MIVLAVACVSAVHGQGVCKLTAAQMPVISGFSLGMEQAKAEKLAGQTAETNAFYFISGGGGRHDPNGKRLKAWAGDSYLFIDNAGQNSKVVDAKVRKLALSFFEGKLFAIELYNTQNVEWYSMNDPEMYFLNVYQLPRDIWQQDLSRNYVSRDAECPDLWIHYDREPRITFTQTDVRAKIAAAIETAKAKAIADDKAANPKQQ